MQRVAQLLDTGSAIVVATVGIDGQVSITRAWGATIADDGHVTACVTAPSGSPIRLSLELGGPIAMNIADPATYQSVQLKGIVDEVHNLADRDSERVESHVGRFSAICAQFGLTDVGRLMIGDLVSIGFWAVEVYDQTPGAGAGRVLG